MLPYREGRLTKVALVIFFILLLGYAYYEAQSMIWGPQIEIPSDTIIMSEPYTEIRGQAKYISELRLNGAIVSVTEDGFFSEPYLLTPGVNRVVLDARDKFGRTRKKSIEIYYKTEAPNSTFTAPFKAE